MALLTPPSDLIGWGYLLLAVVGYFFIQTRLLPTSLWLLVAGGGVAVAWAGNPSGWVETGLGLALAGVSMLPLPPEYREHPANRQRVASPVGPLEEPNPANGGTNGPPRQETSRILEVPPTQTSSNLELSQPANEHSNGSEPTESPSRIAIRAIGHLCIEVDGQEITQCLSEPRLEFLFSYLLARQIRGVEVAAERSGLADEVAPGIGAANQRDRLRKQLYDLQTAHPVFDRLLRTNRSQISLDLQGIDFDAGGLLETNGNIRKRDSLMRADLAEQVRHQLDRSRGEVLAGFSELEHQVTAGKGTAAQVVEEARSAVAGARADLALALAQHDLALGRPGRSISYLTEALSACPQRQDLARALVAAYLQTGQPLSATNVRREHGLEEN
jgi:hypothetical protein